MGRAQRISGAVAVLVGASLSARIEAAEALDFRIVWGGWDVPVATDTAGMRMAASVLERIQGASFREGAIWGVLAGLAEDPRFAAEIDHATRMAKGRSVRVELRPADSLDQIYPGQEIEIPEGGRVEAGSYRVQAGDTLGSLARSWGVPMQAVRASNPTQFLVWPHEDHGTRNHRILRIGETEFRRIPLAERKRVLVHEAAHAGDAAPSCDPDYFYGPDFNHDPREVLSPSAAFVEGWGNYQGSHMGGDPLVSHPPARLAIEKGTAGRYEYLPTGTEIANDFLSNESWVASMLSAVEALPPGRAAVDAAFVASEALACRHIGDFMAAYASRHPDQVNNLMWIVKAKTRVSGQFSVTDEQARTLVVEGILPHCQQGNVSPRRPLDGQVFLPTDTQCRFARDNFDRGTKIELAAAHQAGRLEGPGMSEHFGGGMLGQ